LPTTFGTATIAGPEETVRFTAEPLATLAAAAGLSLMTFPDDTVALDCIVTVPTVRPAPVIEVLADAWVLPTTLGTEAIVLPPPPLEPLPLPPPPPQATKTAIADAATPQRIIIEHSRYLI
jgi:hypothetical protein